MRVLLILLAVTGCSRPADTGPDTAGAESPSEADPVGEAEPVTADTATAAEPPPEPAGVEPLGQCHVGCCSTEILEAQRQMAAESGDPAMANECCFCEE